MRRALAALLCALLGLSAAHAQYVPGFAPGFRPGFQFIGGLPTYDFANGSYPPVSVSRASVAYAADKSGNYTSFAANALRVTNVGATIEGAQTNSIRNDSMQGAVAGSPGTLPTNWAFGALTNCSVNVVGVGVESGIDEIEIQIVATGAASGRLQFDAPAASASTLYANSIFARQTAGSLSSFSGLQYRNISTPSGSALGVVSLLGITSSSLGSQRFTGTGTSGASDTGGRPEIAWTTTGAGNLTIRLGWPNLKQWPAGTGATSMALDSPIRTTGTAATRAADAASITVPAGAGHILYTFDDASTQQVSVSPGAYTIPTNLNRPTIARMQVQP